MSNGRWTKGLCAGQKNVKNTMFVCTSRMMKETCRDAEGVVRTPNIDDSNDEMTGRGRNERDGGSSPLRGCGCGEMRIVIGMKAGRVEEG